MIQTRGLVKRYGSFTAVDGIDLSIPRGEIYGFLGPNGAGKTSTIMMLLGVTRPTAGEIRLLGEAYTPRRLDLRRRIGVVPEKHPVGVWPWMTAREYLGLFADLFEVASPRERIGMLLEKVDLAGVANKRFREFSRGMLQKLSIVRALLPDPDIFISSHQLSEMERICHRVAIISGGRLMVEDTMKSLLSHITPEREVHVELEGPPADLPERVRNLRFVHEASTLGGTLIIKVTKEGDHRRALSEFLIRQGLVPLSITEKVPSLEEAFITITQENLALLTRGGDSGHGGPKEPQASADSRAERGEKPGTPGGDSGHGGPKEPQAGTPGGDR